MVIHYQLLLNRLLKAECYTNNIPLNSTRQTLPDRVCIKDGGADGIFISNMPKNTDFLFSGNMIFQVKATSNFDLSSETSKDNIRNHILSGSAYVLFCNKLSCEGCNALDKEKEYREQIANTLSLSIDDVNFRLYDHSQIAAWIERHFAVKVWLLQTIGEYSGVFKDFESWQYDRNLQNPLKTNDNLLQSIEDIANIVTKNSIVRIEGQSGIGKTRQLLEAIKKHEEIQDLVLYTDQVTVRFNDVCCDIDCIIRDKQKAFVILDDCPYKEFSEIRRILNQAPNKITFISLDYETENNNNKNSLIEYERINLTHVDDVIIENMLQDYFHGINDDDFQKLIELCGQNPRMARIISNYGDCLDFSSCIEDCYLEKLCQTRGKDEKLNRVLEVCSLFKNIYYTTDDDSELLQIANLAELTDSETIKCFNKLKDNLRVIQARYEYHFVIPQILAFQMLLSWLKNSSSTLKNKLNELPNRMKEACYEQMEMLNKYPQVISLTEKLIVPFSQREMLNSQFGAECFLRLSNIVPGKALSVLQKVFSNFSRNDYLQIKDGRRAIVRSLQVIAFHEEYFNEAAEIMLALADAEIESWSNNATGEFLGFFRLYLGGTTCPATKRLSVIKDALSEKNQNKVSICLKALDRALALGHFMRSSGPEKQGSIKLEDWKPKTISDVHDYVNSVLDILQNLILDKSFSLRQEAKDIIGQNLRWILQYRNIDNIVSRLTTLVKFDNLGWDNARIALNHFYEFDVEKYGFTDKEIKKIKKLDGVLTPQNLAERVRFYIISKASWNVYHGKKSDEEIVDEYVPLLLNDEETLNLLLADLNENNNYHIFLLGKKLAAELNEDRIKQFIDSSVEYLISIQKSKQLGGCSFLSGILSGANDDLIDSYIGAWGAVKETAILVLILSRGLKHSSFCYNQLIKVIKSYDWEDWLYFYMPLAGKSSYAEEYNDILHLIDALNEKATQGSLQAVIQILHSILLNNKEIPKQLEPITFNIINNWDLLKQISNSGLHEYECKALWYYCYNKSDDEAKYKVLSNILQHIADKDENDTFLKYHMSDIVKELLDKESIVALRAIFDFCTQNDYNFLYFDIYLSNNFASKEDTYIDKFSWDTLKSFIDKSNEFGLYVAKTVSLFEKDHISDNFRNILENYADNKDMMSALNGNIYNFSWSGNVSDYYIKVKNALIPLLEHPNEKVKEWVNKTVGCLEDDIKREQKNEELFRLGIR